MPDDEDLVTLTIRIKRKYITRLELLRKAVEEKIGRQMTKSDLLDKVLADFFEK